MWTSTATVDYLITHVLFEPTPYQYIRAHICHNFVTIVTLTQRRDRYREEVEVNYKDVDTDMKPIFSKKCTACWSPH